MRKFILFMLCLLLLCATPIAAYAAEDTTGEVVVTEETEKTMTEVVVDYVKEHLEEISVIGTLILTVFYEVRQRGKLNGTIGILNNNAAAVARDSASTIQQALDGIGDVTETVNRYREEFEGLLAEARKNAEEKQALEETLTHVEGFLKTAKLATLELSNEVAELLVLANIPPSKKEELYSRHMTAVRQIEASEATEVTTNDGEKA